MKLPSSPQDLSLTGTHPHQDYFLSQDSKKGEVHYDFVEIMSCPGGCINGGGQPYKEDAVMVEERRHVLYGLDKRDNLRFSHENPSVKQCYEEYFEKPLSYRAHEILHVK